MALLALGCMLNACVTNHDCGIAPVEVPSRWISQTKNSSHLNPDAIRQWWKRFNDPVLDDLISQALCASPDIKSALSRICEARGNRNVQIASMLPSISGNTSDRRQWRDVVNTGLVTYSEANDLTVDMSWEIDLFGRQLQNVKAATKDVKQTIENYYGAQVTLSADVASAYVTLRGAQERLEVLRRNVAMREETTKISRWKQEAGITDMREVQQAVSTLEQVRASIPTFEQTINETKNQLVVLCARHPGQLDELLAQSASQPRIPVKIATGIPAETLNNRPDVQAAVNGVLAAYHRTNAAELERLPSINLSASYGLDVIRSGSNFTPESVARALVGSFVASLVQPIFEGGRITANIQINEEQAKQAVYAYESTILTALSEVENALVAIRRNSERQEVLHRAGQAANEALELATLQFEAGSVDLLTVLDTQRTKFSVEESLVITEADQLRACIQLYKSLGGGWQPLCL